MTTRAPTLSTHLGVVLLAVGVAACGGAEKAERARADSLSAVIVARDDSMGAAARQRALADSIAGERRVQDSIIAERNRPRTVTVFSSTGVEVRYQGYLDYGFLLPAEARACTLDGRVEATAGGSKDIQVMVMSEDQFTNWKNNSRGEGLTLSSQGPQTVTNLQVPLTSGSSYRLVLSNRFSFLTSKTAVGNVEVTCTGTSAHMN